MKKTARSSLLGCLALAFGLVYAPGCSSSSSSSSSSAATTAVSVTWDAVSNATSYLLEEAVDGTSFSQIEELPSSTTSWSSSGLVNGHLYYFRIRAVNAGGDSSYSDIVSISL